MVTLSNQKQHRKEEGFKAKEIKFLTLLSEKYPTIQSVASAIVRLNGILALPKGTEHFISDIHGEYDTFSHILKNASGAIRRKIEEVFVDQLTEKEKRNLATLIYYPEEKLTLLKTEGIVSDEWYTKILHNLVLTAKGATEKYTREQVQEALPQDFKHIIYELLTEVNSTSRQDYYNTIIASIVELQQADSFIKAISYFIQRKVISRLHVIGDIFDRGPYPDKVMDRLTNYHCVDIQWGNHDILWMGAAAGIPICIAAVLRISSRYDNLNTLQDAYGINLFPFIQYATSTYQHVDCDAFTPKDSWLKSSKAMIKMLAQMQKAAMVIEQKLEGALIKRNPNFEMDDRLLLEKIEWEKQQININDGLYWLKSLDFPTIDKNDPYTLTQEESEVMEHLISSFKNSEKLQRHTKFLYAKGSMYLKHNSNLLFHGAIPLKEDGSFESFSVDGKQYKGAALCDIFDQIARKAYFFKPTQTLKENPFADYMWYLWCGSKSPLYGKKKMATFERYLITDKKTHKEERNAYYNLRDNESVVKNILREFGLHPETSHIINGHVPVMVTKGELPVKANGKLIVIDGGMSKPYQKVTGISGYTLIYNSYNLSISQHQTFESRKKAIQQERDIVSLNSLIDVPQVRITIKDTDEGVTIIQEIKDLNRLYTAYTLGIIKPNIVVK